MAFRKRNVDLSAAPGKPSERHSSSAEAPGTRPSFIDGRLTTSTGTPSLDGFLGGHGGLALGTSLLIEENGSTDYGGALLKYYAAEGILQGHIVHVIGAGEAWARSLPGVADIPSSPSQALKGDETGTPQGRSDQSRDRMKIAWRYERLGEFGSSSSATGSRGNPPPNSDSKASTESKIFCHTFDLAKKLTVAGIAEVRHHKVVFTPEQPPYAPALSAISKLLVSTAQQQSIHRIVIPTLLSPALYPSHMCEPQHLLRFAHQLRSLLSQYASRLTVLTTLPLELHPRSTGLIRWLEILSDGVMELTPFPYANDEAKALSTSGAATSQEDKPQGMLRIHKLPVFHERNGGGGGLKGLGDELAFTVSRRKFAIRPFSLPPAEGDTEAQRGQTGSKGDDLTKDKIDF